MNIELPADVEISIDAEVQSGNFASAGDAIAEAWRSFLRQKPGARHSAGLGPIGATQVAPMDRKPIWERAAELRKSVPSEEWDQVPVDGAEQLDHYLHGSPKRPTV